MARPSQLAAYANVEMRLAPLLARMDATGLAVDAAVLQQNKPAIEAQLRQIEQQAHALAGHAFLLSSPKQVCAVLFDELKLGGDAAPAQRSSSEHVLKAGAERAREV